MTFKSGIRRLAGSLALAAVIGTSLSQMTACKKEEPPPPPPPAPPPPPPPPPEPVDLTSLMDSLDGIDARVQFPQEHAPTDRDLAANILQFASALVAKDSEALRPMLSAAGRDVLSQVEQVWWSTDIEAARVVMLTMGGGGQPRGGSGFGGLPGGGEPVPPEALRLLDELGQVALDAMPEDLRAEIPPEDLEQMTSGLSGMQFGEASVEDMTAEQLAGLIGFFKPIIDQMATGDPSQVADQMSQMMGNFAPEGMDIPTDVDFEMDEETRAQMERMQPVFVAVSNHLDKVLAALGAEPPSESDSVETSDSSATFVTAFQDADGSYVLMWDAQRFDDGWFFSPLAATDEMRQSVRDWDGGTLNDFRVEVATAPIIPEIPDLDDDTDNPSRPDSGGGGGTSGG